MQQPEDVGKVVERKVSGIADLRIWDNREKDGMNNLIDAISECAGRTVGLCVRMRPMKTWMASVHTQCGREGGVKS